MGCSSILFFSFIMFSGRNRDTKNDLLLDLHDHGAKEAIRLLKCHLSSLSGIPSEYNFYTSNLLIIYLILYEFMKFMFPTSNQVPQGHPRDEWWRYYQGGSTTTSKSAKLVCLYWKRTANLLTFITLVST